VHAAIPVREIEDRISTLRLLVDLFLWSYNSLWFRV